MSTRRHSGRKASQLRPSRKWLGHLTSFRECETPYQVHQRRWDILQQVADRAAAGEFTKAEQALRLLKRFDAWKRRYVATLPLHHRSLYQMKRKFKAVWVDVEKKSPE